MEKRDIQKLIVDTTIEILEEKGYKKTTTNEIAERAGISIGTLYYHYKKGKPSIIKDLIRREFNDYFIADIPKNLAKNEVPKYFRMLLVKLIQQHRKHSALTTALSIALLSDQELFEELETSRVLGHWDLVPIISNNVLRFGNIQPEKRARISMLLFLIIDDLIHRYTIYPTGTLKSERMTDDDLVDFIIELVFKYIDFDYKSSS